MLYLLTGAAGFLGREVAKGLIAQGLPVRALVLPGDPLADKLPPGTDIRRGDLLSGTDLDSFFEGTGGDTTSSIAPASSP